MSLESELKEFNRNEREKESRRQMESIVATATTYPESKNAQRMLAWLKEKRPKEYERQRAALQEANAAQVIKDSSELAARVARKLTHPDGYPTMTPEEVRHAIGSESKSAFYGDLKSLELKKLKTGKFLTKSVLNVLKGKAALNTKVK